MMKIKYNWNAIIPTVLGVVFLSVLPLANPCATEDSRVCTWNAQEQGNATGNSFVDYYGLTVYLP